MFEITNLLILKFRYAKFTMDKALANSEMDIPLKENWDTVSFTEKELSSGLMELFIKENSKTMKLQDKAVTNGQTNHGMKEQLKTD